jgi:hypothetical protein
VLVSRIRGTFPQLFLGSFTYPLSARGLLTMIVGGAVFASLAYIGLGTSMFGAAVLVTYLYFLVRASALGEQDLPKWKELLALGQLVLGIVRFAPALFTTLLPFIGYVVFFKHWAGIGAYTSDPIAYATLSIGVLWTPMAFMLAAAASPLTTILNPIAAARSIWRIAGAYFTMTFMLCLLAAGTSMIYVLGRFFAATLELPVLPVMYAAAVTLYLPLVGGRLLGVLLLKRGADMGIADLPEYLVPALEPSMLQPEPVRERADDSDLDIDFSNSPHAIELPESPAETAVPIDALVPIASATRAGDLTTNSEELAEAMLTEGVIEVPESADDLVVSHQLSQEVQALPSASAESLDLGAALDGDPSDLTLTEATFTADGADPNGVLSTPPNVDGALELSDVSETPETTGNNEIVGDETFPTEESVEATAIPAQHIHLGVEVARIELKKREVIRTDLRTTEVLRPSTPRPPPRPPPRSSESRRGGAALAEGPPADLSPEPPHVDPTLNGAAADRMELEGSTTPAPPAVFPSEEPTDDDVRFMAEAEDYDSIVDAYRTRKGAITVLTDEELFRTAEAAQNMSDMATAAHVLRRLAHDHPKSSLAPDAMLNAGILLVRELDSPGDGKRVLNRLIRLYPESTAAISARRLVDGRK